MESRTLGEGGATWGRGAGPVLVVDDSAVQRRLVSALLERRGFEAVTAPDGLAALEILAGRPVELMITDWLMPGPSGPELVAELRRREREAGGYTYAILLTAKTGASDIEEAIAAGADDFLTKPVAEAELLARMRAGLRMVRMQRSLAAQTESVTRAYTALAGVHDQLDRDLRVAAALMAEIAPPRVQTVEGLTVAALCRPAGHVGGDLVGAFPAGPGRACAFAIDVSGHGVASALRTMHLAQLFTRSDPSANIALVVKGDGPPLPRDPAEVVAALNDRLLDTADGLYLTMALAVVEAETGEGTLCRAGHPEPLILSPDGGVRRLPGGGMPVGLLAGGRWEAERFRLAPGERLVLQSDGLLEARDAAGAMHDIEGISALLSTLADRDAPGLVDALVEGVARRSGLDAFEDDVSVLVLERPPPAQSAASRTSASSDTARRTSSPSTSSA